MARWLPQNLAELSDMGGGATAGSREWCMVVLGLAKHTRSSGIRREARRRYRQPAGFSARQRRAGPRDCRGAHPLRQRRRRRRHSVAALVPRAEIEGEMARRRWGCRRGSCRRRCASSPAASRNRRRCIIFINQLREKIGVMFGNPETTTGGRALKFYASIRIDIRRIACHQGWRCRCRGSHPREGREE